MTPSGVLRSPRSVLFGAGQRHALGKVARQFGARAFVCTDARLGTDKTFLAMIDNLQTAGMQTKVYDATIVDLPIEGLRQSAEAAKAFMPDVVIGVGGGSCLDAAKFTALMVKHGDRLQNFYGELLVPGPIVPVIAVPTTSGTGSEVSPVAVLTDSERIMKVGVASPHLIPDVAVCDPELTYTCPPGLTATAGVDALTHAIEAFTAIRREATSGLALERVFIGKNTFSDHFALLAIGCVARSLRRAVQNGGDVEARAEVMLGALYAGYAFGMAGTAAAHAIQYPVGAATHSAHGLGVAALMPYVMEFNKPARIQEFAQIATAMDPSLTEKDPAKLADIAIDKVAELMYAVGVPKTLAGLGLKEDKVRWTAEQAVSAARLVKNNPRDLDVEGLAQITQAAFTGDRASLRR